MAEAQVYLFKAARRPLYRKENLQLLAAERGSVLEVAYNRMWVSPEYLDPDALPRGTRACVVFTERPYAAFVPVRTAEILESATDDLMLRLRLLLRSWVSPADRDIRDFTRLVRQVAAEAAPGQKFVVPKRDGLPLVPHYDERENEGWRRVVDEVLAMSGAGEDDPYQESVFFRPVGLRVDGELYVARRVPLEVGARAALVLQFHNPHLSSEDADRHQLRVLARETALRVDAPESFPLEGELELPLEVVGLDPELTVQIAPAAAQHTSATVRLQLRDRPSRVAVPGVPGAEDDDARPEPERRRRPRRKEGDPGDGDRAGTGAVPAEDVLDLVDVVFRNADLRPGDDLDVLDAFQRLLPHEQSIAERRGMSLAAQDRARRRWSSCGASTRRRWATTRGSRCSGSCSATSAALPPPSRSCRWT